MSPGKVEKEKLVPLSLGPFIIGGAGFSYQLVNEPEKAPAVDILLEAFKAGVRTIDTSPYYDPSELILGAALADSRITQSYSRKDYKLMTKVGRISSSHFDYSAKWIHKSIRRSLERFRTSYLDVVFCHDVEFVSPEEAVAAVGTLFELCDEGIVNHVGISGFNLETLSQVAMSVLETYGRPVCVVQTWAQLTLQNTCLESSGLAKFRAAGIRTICSSSPLAVGLLSSRGVPVGGLGDWHPAPEGLRIQARKAAEELERVGESMSSLALRFAIRKAISLTTADLHISTISGVASVDEVVSNLAAARQVLGENLGSFDDETRTTLGSRLKLEQKDKERCALVRDVLGPWVDYSFS
ncbi:Aldo/keto reductase [Pyrenochaeta sp. DS3sAY3a]|nr:Aldo/keto reductase [Pyrenochaeta sp. DS3sAY3a]